MVSISRYALQPLCVFFSRPSSSQPEDATCNESLLIYNIFSPDFCFVSSLITLYLDTYHSDRHSMFKKANHYPRSEVIGWATCFVFNSFFFCCKMETASVIPKICLMGHIIELDFAELSVQSLFPVFLASRWRWRSPGSAILAITSVFAEGPLQAIPRSPQKRYILSKSPSAGVCYRLITVGCSLSAVTPWNEMLPLRFGH